MGSASEMRDRLAREDPQFRRLVEEHEAYDRRLRELQSCRWRNEEEEIEVAKLKKMKLAVKDKMESMLLRTAP